MKPRDAMLAAVVMGLAVTYAHAQDADPAPLRWEAAPGVQAQAEVQEGGSIAVLLTPSGTRQVLPGAADADGTARLSAEDVDFDGRPELVARASVGMVNEAVAVYRYDPAEQQVVALEPVSTDGAQCGGLMGLTVDAATRTLGSSCRGGPMWYVDQYRYDGTRLYLYRAERLLMLDELLEPYVLVKQTANSGPLAVWSTFDPAGKVLETAIGDGLDTPPAGTPLVPVSGRVMAARLPLYSQPGDAATKRYLVRDDRVELLDERDGWVQVRYENPTRGAVRGWVNTQP
ncbi:MAG: XAC2610-related protein [Stenotrophomonas maltophilia]